MSSAQLDRRRMVRRHNPVLTAAHPTAVLTVGNGDAAMSVDITGTQTFGAFHALAPAPVRSVKDGVKGLPEQPARLFDADDFQIPVQTQTTWAWYESTPARPYDLREAAHEYRTARGMVPYLDGMGLQRAADDIPESYAAGAWFQFNPRRAHLGRIALVGLDDMIALDSPARLANPRAELDLWSGRIVASFLLENQPVTVTTVADPSSARFAVRLESPLLRIGLGLAWVFDGQPDDLSTFEQPLAESTDWRFDASGHAVARRQVETLTYLADVATTGELIPSGPDATAATTSSDVLDLVVTLSPDGTAVDGASFDEVSQAAAEHWQRFWMDGAAVSFEGSSDPRAAELERRVVLSQYLTAVNGAGTMPPPETGLTYNSWSGKFHLEMHWWHSAQFALWGRGELLERSLGWYHETLPAAIAAAQWQGYQGARWPKQTDPSGRESPSTIGVFLIWQQPHIIHLLELLYYQGKGPEFLAEHLPLVEATADFMADFVEPLGESFVLPPPLIPAQESYLAGRATNVNPTFELAYWAWALDTANEWRARLGLPSCVRWATVSSRMSRPTLLRDGTYAPLATAESVMRKDHPSTLMALGWLPDSRLIDPEIMRATFDGVWSDWDLQSTWGWDYPLLAMTAARLGDLGRALDALLLPSPKNVFLPNGHNPQIPGLLSLYLPANGGLLAAIAHIVSALRDGAPLPSGWSLRAEGFCPLPGRAESRTDEHLTKEAEGGGPAPASAPAEPVCSV